MSLTSHSFIPPGWSYNPSAWRERVPLLLIAFAGFMAAGYLALYQFRIIDHVWEPFFGNGSIKILNSSVSSLLPVPDAALGAFGYLLDIIAGVIGAPNRWKTMPWIVIVFGLFVGPLGAVSILLVVLQPVLFNAWCTFCLVSAVCSVIMIGPAMDEMLASLQYMAKSKGAGLSLWKVFWGYQTSTLNKK
ncbi:MAG TPA: vitamin K epoxide reductase family protein [Bacteroidales bacterium]|nr:vitamin K epoxide reductase family protein [Bacteroidales bacterium]